MWRDGLLLGAIVLYVSVVLLVDILIWPGHTVPVFLALPLIISALRQPPRFVVIVAAMAVLGEIVDVVVERTPPAIWPVTLLTLLAIGYAAVLVAIGRQEARRRARRQAAMIETVQELRQPLTVVLARTQLLRRMPVSPTEAQQHLSEIESSAHVLHDLISRLLERSPNG